MDWASFVSLSTTAVEQNAQPPSRLAAGARRDMPLAPADTAVTVPHLDDDRLELGESAVGQNIRTNQWKANGPQLEFLQLIVSASTAIQPTQVIRSLPLIW